jgi:hypothetical protein
MGDANRGVLRAGALAHVHACACAHGENRPRRARFLQAGENAVTVPVAFAGGGKRTDHYARIPALRLDDKVIFEIHAYMVCLRAVMPEEKVPRHERFSAGLPAGLKQALRVFIDGKIGLDVLQVAHHKAAAIKKGNASVPRAELFAYERFRALRVCRACFPRIHPFLPRWGNALPVKI